MDGVSLMLALYLVQCEILSLLKLIIQVILSDMFAKCEECGFSGVDDGGGG